MAPEQRRGNAGDYTFLADMYSLGLICFEMFVGGFKTIIEMDKAFSHLR
jgi:serine/threonine protein kinase